MKKKLQNIMLILDKLQHLINLIISFVYLFAVNSALDFSNNVRQTFMFGFTLPGTFFAISLSVKN